jgi:hypothetical protein
MEYTSYQYLFPPRPEKAIPTGLLPFYAKKKWIGQYKKNGTCNILVMTPEYKFIAMNRHGEEHKAWAPTELSTAPFKLLEPGWYVFVSEVLNNKVPGIRDTQYVFDLLVYKGVYLVGSTLSSRLSILHDMFSAHFIAETYSHYVITPNVWLAKTITSGFLKKFEAIENPEDEGLVLKNPEAELEHCMKGANNGWQVKCRKPHKNFSF